MRRIFKGGIYFEIALSLPASSGLYKDQVVRWCDVQSLVHAYKIIPFTKKFEDISKFALQLSTAGGKHPISREKCGLSLSLIQS